MKQLAGLARLCWCVVFPAFLLLGAGLAPLGAQNLPSPDATTPPLVRSGLKLPDIQLHDPWIVADQSARTYYLYSAASRRITGEGRTGTLYYTSKDLASWEGPYIAFVAPKDSWADSGVNAWAPEVHAYHRAGEPWMVYAHEWLQKVDGTMEAIPLNDDLSAATGAPMHLFKASDAPWLNAQMVPSAKANNYVTDGPELFRTKSGTLLMLWASYMQNELGRNGYVQTIARSKSGELKGPWEQLEPLIGNDSGHGMLFRAFDGKLMLVLHQPFQNARGKIYEMEDTGDGLRVVKYREDLSGPPLAPLPGQAPL